MNNVIAVSNKVLVFTDSNATSKLKTVPVDSSINKTQLQKYISCYPNEIINTISNNDVEKWVCISTNIQLQSGSIVDNILISSNGRIAVFTDNLNNDVSEIKKWNTDILNKLCEDYTYVIQRQSSTILDLMVQNGYLTYSDDAKFCKSITYYIDNNLIDVIVPVSCIHNGDTIVLPVSVDKFFSNNSSNSRINFINKYADIEGLDPDELIEFISEIESINGITVTNNNTELKILFSLDDCLYPLFAFSIVQYHTSFYIIPSIIKSALKMHGYFPFDADEFLNHFKQYLIFSECSSQPFESDNETYYADINKAIPNTDELSKSIDKFISSLQIKE